MNQFYFEKSHVSVKKGFPRLYISFAAANACKSCLFPSLGGRKGAKLLVVGNGNVLMNNLADGNVILEGEGNVVSGLVFTSPEACLILRGAARESTSVMAVEPSRIRRE